MAQGVGLIASMDQSFSPTVPEALQRFRSRADDMPLQQRARRLGSNLILQRGLMPPVLSSLKAMRRVANAVHDERLFANLYAEELPANGCYHDYAAPYVRSAVLAPDVVEKLGVPVAELPKALRQRGISNLAFDSYHAARTSQSGQTELPPWQEYLPAMAEQGLFRQIRISMNRYDLPATTGLEPMAQTYNIATELTKSEALTSRLGPMPEQIACIVERQPAEQPLDFTLVGDLTKFEPGQLQNAYHNLGQLAALSM